MKILLLLLVVSCGPQLPAVISGIGETAACVIAHDTEPPVQIAVDCGGIAIADVNKILDADKASKVRAQCAIVPTSPGK